MKALAVRPVLGALVLLTGCAGSPAGRGPALPTAAVDAMPPCPAQIERGGDPVEAASLEGKPIARVCIVGGSTETRQRAERLPLLRAGDPVSAERVRADLAALVKLDVFADASAYGTLAPHGASVVLLYEVTDRPLLASIRVEGAKALGDSALTRELPLVVGAPFDPQAAHRVAMGVRDGYRTLGYESCKVVVTTEPEGARVRVGIMVDEGIQSRLSKLDFRGNKRVAETELRQATTLAVGQPYVQDEVDQAIRLMSSVLFDRGLVAMTIAAERGKIDKAGNVPLTIVIDEGDVHTLSAIHLAGLGAPFEKELLEKVIRVRAKQTFVRSVLVEDLKRIEAFFDKRGQRVTIVPQTERDAKKHAIDLTLVVDERP